MISLEEENKIKEKRGEILTNFAFVEDVMKSFIAGYYVNDINHPIVPEIFEDEYFSFGLLFKIFEKVLKKQEDKSFPLQQLRRMSQLRNIVVHASVRGNATSPSTDKIVRIFFRHAGEEKEISEVFDEYDELKTLVQASLLEKLREFKNTEVLPERRDVFHF